MVPTGGTVLAHTDATHLAQTIPAPFLFAGWSCQDMITTDPAPGQSVRTRDGMMAITGAPGLGVVPDADWLGEPVARYA